MLCLGSAFGEERKTVKTLTDFVDETLTITVESGPPALVELQVDGLEGSGRVSLTPATVSQLMRAIDQAMRECKTLKEGQSRKFFASQQTSLVAGYERENKGANLQVGQGSFYIQPASAPALKAALQQAIRLCDAR